jgi:hypothetical protein
VCRIGCPHCARAISARIGGIVRDSIGFSTNRRINCAYRWRVIRYWDFLTWLFDRQKKSPDHLGLVRNAIYRNIASENIRALKPIAPIRLTVNVGASSSFITCPLQFYASPIPIVQKMSFPFQIALPHSRTLI